jgi:hypothetical protein
MTDMEIDMEFEEFEGPGKIWLPFGPEDRLSIVFDRFLTRALLQPSYATAINDSDDGTRSVRQRGRAASRGVKKGQLDWDVVQGPPYLHRKVELKRKKNGLTANQEVTKDKLTRCGGTPIVGKELRPIYLDMVKAGFRFAPNVETVLQHCEAFLAAIDREAEGIRDGSIVKPRAPYRKRKQQHRYTWPARAVG